MSSRGAARRGICGCSSRTGQPTGFRFRLKQNRRPGACPQLVEESRFRNPGEHRGEPKTTSLSRTKQPFLPRIICIPFTITHISPPIARAFHGRGARSLPSACRRFSILRPGKHKTPRSPNQSKPHTAPRLAPSPVRSNPRNISSPTCGLFRAFRQNRKYPAGKVQISVENHESLTDPRCRIRRNPAPIHRRLQPKNTGKTPTPSAPEPALNGNNLLDAKRGAE